MIKIGDRAANAVVGMCAVAATLPMAPAMAQISANPTRGG